MPAEKARRTVGHGDPRRLRIDDRNIAVVIGVIGRIEVPNEGLMLLQFSGKDIDGNAEPMTDLLTMKLGVDPLVRIFSSAGTAAPISK